MELNDHQKSLINQAFGRAAVVKLVSGLPPYTPARIREQLFGKGKKHAEKTLKITLKDVSHGNLPLTMRGAPSYPASGTGTTLIELDPEPIRIRDNIPIHELDDFLGARTDSREARVTDILQVFRDRVAQTVDALCAQAATGQLDYPVYDGSGVITTTMTLNYGTVHGAGMAANFSTMDIDAITAHLFKMAAKVRRGGAPVVFFASLDVATVIAAQARTAKRRDVAFDVDKGFLGLGPLQIWIDESTYYNHATGQTERAISATEVMAASKDGHGYKYLPVYDLKGRPQMDPLLVSTWVTPDPLELAIKCESRPVPFIAPEAICRAQVINGS